MLRTIDDRPLIKARAPVSEVLAAAPLLISTRSGDADTLPETFSYARSWRGLAWPRGARPAVLLDDNRSTINEIDEILLRVSKACSGNLFPVSRRGSVWPLRRLWTTQCGLGQLCPLRRLYRQAQLVFARDNDPSFSVYHHGWRNSPRRPSCSRLQNSDHCLSQWSSSDQLCTCHGCGFGSESTSKFFRFLGRRSFPPGDVHRVSFQFGQPASIALIALKFCSHLRGGPSRPFRQLRVSLLVSARRRLGPIMQLGVR